MTGIGRCLECGRFVPTHNLIFADHAAKRGGHILCDGSGLRDVRTELGMIVQEINRDETALAWNEHVMAGGD